MVEYVPFVPALFLGPGAFLPRPEDRRQPPFLDQLYASNGGCPTSICHRVGDVAAVQRGRGGEAGWPAAPPGRLVASAEVATLLASHDRAMCLIACRVRGYASSAIRVSSKLLILSSTLTVERREGR